MDHSRNKFSLITKSWLIILGSALLLSCATSPRTTPDVADKGDVEFWLTTGDKTSLLSKSYFNWLDKASDLVIDVDSKQTFQTMDGFGFSLTGGSAYLLKTKLTDAKRKQLLEELFLTRDNGIGISYLRISVGASDLDDHVFSYDDVKSAQPDVALDSFTIKADQQYLIPVLKEIISLNPQIKIMASPWSAPAWMKTNKNAKAGSLLPEYYNAYAQYLAKYIAAMAQEGITIDAITLQNEPENPKNTPSMIMTAEDQANFVKQSLGPVFKNANIKTRIVIFDHNCDHPEYPVAVLNDKEANPYIDGTAFHLYLGEIEALNEVYKAHPDKNLYFTEQWTSGNGSFSDDLEWHTKNLVIGAPRNWSKNVLEWNLAADENFDPHTNDGGCTLCMGALTIDGSAITRNVSYYIIAHASKFVPMGSVRIASNLINGIDNVAFLTPEGKHVLIAVNDGEDHKPFTIRSGSKMFNASLPKGGVGTFVW
jgi:glucosylceramidase